MNTLLFMSFGDGDTPIALMGIMLPIIISLGAFLMIFGLRYLRSRERTAMIERGIDPGNYRNSSFSVLRPALLFIGVGTGLTLAYLITQGGHFRDDSDPLYFALLFLFGGAGLLISFLVERHTEKNRK